MPETIGQYISVFIMGFMTYIGLIRNTQVSRFKQKWIKAISNYQQERIDKHQSLDFDAYESYNQIGYHKIVWLFWKSPDSFVPAELKKKIKL